MRMRTRHAGLTAEAEAVGELKRVLESLGPMVPAGGLTSAYITAVLALL